MFSPSNPGRDCRWWVDDHDDERSNRIQRGQRLSNVVATIYRSQESLRQSMLIAWRLYSNQPCLGLSPRNYRARGAGPRNQAQGLNLVRACTDSYSSLITKDRPRTFYDVSGGDRKLKKRAKALQKFTDGLAEETKLADKDLTIVRDSAIFGHGILKTFRSDDQGDGPRIATERRFPWNILVDEQEAASGQPQNLYELMWVDRQALMAEYPELASEIRLASSTALMDGDQGNSYTDANFVDFAVVVEAWHLPRVSGKKGSGDGRHTLMVGSVVLKDEPYYWHRFPFSWCYRATPLQGMYGLGIPLELAPVQLEINRIMFTISQSQRLAVGHWFVESNSDVDTSAINNIVASVVRWTGVRPEYIQFPPVTGDVYAYLWALWQKGFEALGLSQLASMSQIPQGLKSGTAIETYADVGSDRFKPAYKCYQAYHKDVTEQILHLARDIAEDDPSFEVKSTGAATMMKAVKWAEAGLKDDEFNIKLKEVNQLGEDVPSKIQAVTDMASAGYIDPDATKELLMEDGGMPDLAGFESIDGSRRQFVQWCADKACDEGDFVQPNPYMGNVQKAIDLMSQLYLRAQMDGVEDDRLRLLRLWMDQAAQFLPAPPQAPPVPAPGGPPPGQPMPPPNQKAA